MTLHARLASLLLACLFAAPAAAIDLSRKPAAGSADALLSADAAFKLVSVIHRRDAILVNWQIEPGYYLYRQRIAVEAVDAGVTLAAPILPTGIAQHDEHFGDVEIYKSAVELRLPLAAGAPVPTQLRLRWQGCAEAGVCYPPVTRVVAVSPAS
ncbi:MAG: protein-disulfide reductase DsbD N-terminal domain-containing protein [Nevskia sp.]|nr:protein-disulfide reductase DsbD N-terminal domain-containing protein [Nevskia sp.]